MKATMTFKDNIIDYRNRYWRLKTKEARGRFLTRLCEAFGLEREYLIKLLNGLREFKPPRGRGRTYGKEVERMALKLRRLAADPCAPYFVAMLPRLAADWESLRGQRGGHAVPRGEVWPHRAATPRELPPLGREGGPAMLTFRIIPCLDVRDRRVTKGVKFQNNIDLGDPVEMAARYHQDGCDELVVYDITASAERRSIDIGIVRDVAAVVRIPFAVGGGISSLDDMRRVLLAGAEKVSVDSLAISNPQVIAEGARAFGSQCIVLWMNPVWTPDVARFPSGYEITARGFRVRTGMDAGEWAWRSVDLGTCEIVVNSVDADGTRADFDLEIKRKIADAVGMPVIASGGAGKPEHLEAVWRDGHADAAIVAGMLHTGEWTVSGLNAAMRGVPLRMPR